MMANWTTGEFWGLKVDGTITICPVERPFRVTKAVLNKPSKLTGDQYASVHLKGIEICKFTSGDNLDKNLNFTIRKGDNITFTVNGSPAPSIHLVGYYIPEEAAPLTTETLSQKLDKLLNNWKDKIIVDLSAEKRDFDKFMKLNESAAASTASIVALREAVDKVEQKVEALENHVKCFKRFKKAVIKIDGETSDEECCATHA